jgi:hypothetical protein
MEVCVNFDEKILIWQIEEEREAQNSVSSLQGGRGVLNASCAAFISYPKHSYA